ncbi:MAG: porphobilinogen synthase [Elusimicrobia bacterium]|nr:porphobilinogen synthase [Elusimicrobiota bacterium]
MAFPAQRLRRLRASGALRSLVRETELSPKDLVLPLFVRSGRNLRNPIASLPGHFQYSVDRLVAEVRDLRSLQIAGVILFGIPARKDSKASGAYARNGIIQQAVRALKEAAPEALVITDLCFCEYTDHGHCGFIRTRGEGWVLDNDVTLEWMAKTAVSQAEAGADLVAPSGMMDGQVRAIRQALDRSGFAMTPILSYAAKYASAFYGPFREAAESPPQFGDRLSYQMDPANFREALREVEQDVEEGADMILVKPALPYLDVLRAVRERFPVPVGAYSVSGEFAMIRAAAQKGWLDEKKAVLEALVSIKRAGADFILTYFAKEAAQWLREG